MGVKSIDGHSERLFEIRSHESVERSALAVRSPRASTLTQTEPIINQMTTPDLHLRTLYALDERGRIAATREPGPNSPPLFCLVRSVAACVWAVRADVPDGIAAEINALARSERPAADLREQPVHAERYESLLGGRVSSGPAFSFPDALPDPGRVVLVDDMRALERYFRGWTEEEIPGCSPVVAVLEDGHAASVCFCARRSGEAAEAGLETAEPFRGRGLAPRVTAAWALAVRATGRTPLYSTSWDNGASLAVARKLRLHAYASNWSVYG